MKKLSIIFPLLFCLSVLNSQTMAVLEFEGKGISQVEASALTDRLNNEIYKLGKYTLVERNQIEEILQEQGFQQSGCTSAECVVEVGRLLGAEKMVVGSISRVGDVFSVSARIVDMQSGEIEKFVNPHPKDLSKSPAFVGFFVSPHLSLHSTVRIRKNQG